MRFKRCDIRNIVCLHASEDSEPCWHYVHLDIGSIAVCNWYRPGAAGLDPILFFRSEVLKFRDDVIGYLVCGDINARRTRWLRHSNANIPEEILLKQVADDSGFRQLSSRADVAWIKEFERARVSPQGEVLV